MAFKLYDFQDPEMDEQIRLICDVLYNHREEYPGQISSSSPYDAFWTNQNFTWVKPSGNRSGGVSTSLINHAGTILTATTSGTNPDLSTQDEFFATVASSTSGSRCGWAAEATFGFPGSTNQTDQLDEGFYIFARLSLSKITGKRFALVIGNTNPTNNDNPWGSASTTHGGLAFNFLPSTSANWFACGKLFGTTTLGFNQDLSVPVVANQIYNLEIVVKGVGSARTASFWIDGIKYHTVTGNTTYTANPAQPTSWNVALYPTENVIKQVGVSRLLWGTRPSVVQPVPHGYRVWTGQES